MIYDFTISMTALSFKVLLILTLWFLAPLLFRVKETMAEKGRSKKSVWAIFALLVCLPYLLVVLILKGLSMVFYTLYEWTLKLTAMMLEAVISDEKKS